MKELESASVSTFLTRGASSLQSSVIAIHHPPQLQPYPAPLQHGQHGAQPGPVLVPYNPREPQATSAAAVPVVPATAKRKSTGSEGVDAAYKKQKVTKKSTDVIEIDSD